MSSQQLQACHTAVPFLGFQLATEGERMRFGSQGVGPQSRELHLLLSALQGVTALESELLHSLDRSGQQACALTPEALQSPWCPSYLLSPSIFSLREAAQVTQEATITIQKQLSPESQWDKEDAL